MMSTHAYGQVLHTFVDALLRGPVGRLEECRKRARTLGRDWYMMVVADVLDIDYNDVLLNERAVMKEVLFAFTYSTPLNELRAVFEGERSHGTEWNREGTVTCRK